MNYDASGVAFWEDFGVVKQYRFELLFQPTIPLISDGLTQVKFTRLRSFALVKDDAFMRQG